MKELSELNFPDNLRYDKEHEWVLAENDTATIGISDYAQDQLGDVVFVELPEVGATLSKEDEFGTVESVKAVSELYMPISGEIIAINTELEENPERVNVSPYDTGWMIKVKPSDKSELEALMDNTEYVKMLGS